MLIKTEPEYMSRIGNGDSNVCSVYQIKPENWI